MYKTRVYRSWINIKARCFNPNHKSYADYGGRGIGMCPDYVDDFQAYYADVGDAPKGLSIERWDNARGYEPGNLGWATPKEQVANRRPYKKRKPKP